MVQWGLVHGIEGTRITGKEDICFLIGYIPMKDELIVMDISHARNQKLAQKISSTGIKITWFDHHLAGDELSESNQTLTLTRSLYCEVS